MFRSVRVRRHFLDISVKLLVCGSDIIIELSVKRSWANESMAVMLNCILADINLEK